MTGLARIGEEVEDQFELWALINREKHFGGERGLDGEREGEKRGEIMEERNDLSLLQRMSQPQRC